MTRLPRQGFTIIEVLIATAILGIGLAAMMGMQVAFVNGSRSASDNQVATAVGQAVVEQLKTEATTWTRNRSPNLDEQRHPRLAKIVSAGEYVHLWRGHPVNADLVPYHENSEDYINESVYDRAKVGARYCVDVQARMLENLGNTVIAGQVRVSWPTDGSAPWNVNGGRCNTNGDNLESFLTENGQARPGRRSVLVPFIINQNMYPGEDL